MIYKLAYKLNEELLKDEIILNVKEKEMNMNNNHEFIRLIMYYDSLKTEINDLERFNLDTKEKQKELFELKIKIDTLKEVKEYNEAYVKAKDYLTIIAKEVFSDIDDELKLNSLL